jgi:hypothetical protein
MLVVVVHACNPSTQEAKTGGLEVPAKNGIHSETLSPKKTSKPNKTQAIQYFRRKEIHTIFVTITDVE